jgi:LysR family transcriptional activator of dmlA
MIEYLSQDSSPKVNNDLASHLEFFVLLARHGSLSAAARALDLTPPAATKRLAQLEARLGVRLVNRTTRTSSLTPEGETYLQHATRILADLHEMEEAVSSTRAVPRGLLRVNASLGFGRTTIAPLVSTFAQRYPQVEVQLDVTDRPVDLVASVADLASHRCIVHRQNDEAHGVWRLEHEGRAVSVKVQGALSSNDGDIVLGWALDGHGILVRSEWDLAKYVDSGRLRIVLPGYAQPEADLFVVYPNTRGQSARARAFIDFLVAHFGA